MAFENKIVIILRNDLLTWQKLNVAAFLMSGISGTQDIIGEPYTEEIFKTYNDEDNRAKVAEYKTDDLNLVGIGMIGKKNHVDRLIKGLSLHE